MVKIVHLPNKGALLSNILIEFFAFFCILWALHEDVLLVLHGVAAEVVAPFFEGHFVEPACFDLQVGDSTSEFGYDPPIAPRERGGVVLHTTGGLELGKSPQLASWFEELLLEVLLVLFFDRLFHRCLSHHLRSSWFASLLPLLAEV